MRSTLAVAAVLSFALAACGSGTDAELADEALSMEEVAGAADDFEVPTPGEYRNRVELLAFENANIPESQMAMVRAAFAEGAAMESTYCMTEEMTREQWLSNVSESNCTVSQFDTAGGQLDIVMQCAASEGISGRVEAHGTADSDGSDLEMTFTQAIPGMGDSTIRMRVQSDRVGECS